MSDFNFEIQQKLGTLSEKSSGWSKQLTLTQWGDNEAKYDIREWSPSFDKMGKGITFSREELMRLRDLLNDLDLY